jgi:hypothetical protein
MARRSLRTRLIFTTAILLAAVLPGIASAQLPPTLNPGDRYQFLGADVDADIGPGCDGLVNGCGVDYGDLGANSPRMYVSSVVNAGIGGTTRSATGRLAHWFSVSPGPGRRIGAKLIGFVKWRGWLQADLGAYDNTSSSLIGVSIYDVTTGTRQLVANQRIQTNSVSGTISDLPVPNFVRDIGSGGFDLAVDLERGHEYMAAVEATCTSTSGLVGFFAASSYSTFGNGHSALNDGFIEQTSMAITLEPDYLAAVDSLREDFEHHTHNYLTGRGVGQNNTQAVTSGPIDDMMTAPPVLPDGPPGGGPVPPSLTVETAATDHVQLLARILAGSESPTVERRTGDTDWAGIASVVGDGMVLDPSVTAGMRYGYRLRAMVNGAEILSDEIWVDIPARLNLGIERTGPNPLAGPLDVTFTLPEGSPATLALFDVQGRLVMTRDVGSLGAGRHSLAMPSSTRIASGIYLLRLTQAGKSVSTKVALLH